METSKSLCAPNLGESTCHLKLERVLSPGNSAHPGRYSKGPFPRWDHLSILTALAGSELLRLYIFNRYLLLPPVCPGSVTLHEMFACFLLARAPSSQAEDDFYSPSPRADLKAVGQQAPKSIAPKAAHRGLGWLKCSHKSSFTWRSSQLKTREVALLAVSVPSPRADSACV